MKPRPHTAQHGCSSDSHSTDGARLSRPWPGSPHLESIVHQRVHKVLCAQSDQLHPAKAYAHALVLALVLAAQPPQLLCLSHYAQQLIVAGGASFVQVVLGQLRRDLGGHRIRDKGAQASSRVTTAQVLTVRVQSRTAPSSCWTRSACLGSSISWFGSDHPR